MVNGIIVGVDPGTTTAICVLDLNGGVREIYSSKNLSVNETIRRIARTGDPVFIATDVAKAPASITKIAAAFAAQVFAPKENISTLSKHQLHAEFKAQNPEARLNRHEKDALAAAVLAHAAVKNKLAKLGPKLINLTESQKEHVRKQVLSGTRTAIALKELSA